MNRQVYETMAGPSEFFGTGTLMDWDVTARLAELDLPALITSGAHDEVTPRQAELLHAGIAGSRRVVFEHSAHCAVVEEPDRYRAVLEEFLATADPQAGVRRRGRLAHVPLAVSATLGSTDCQRPSITRPRPSSAAVRIAIPTKRRTLLVATLLAVGVAALAGTGSASAQSEGNDDLGSRVERLGAEVRVLSRRLGRTRVALRRQVRRLARVERRLELREQGPAAGLRSPDGRFAVDVSNEGVQLRAPSTSLFVGAAGVTLASGANTTLQLAAGRTTLASPVVSLGGSACPPVVRLGDPLLVRREGETLLGTIAGSSMGVFAC